jgi:hypothetical protein
MKEIRSVTQTLTFNGENIGPDEDFSRHIGSSIEAGETKIYFLKDRIRVFDNPTNMEEFTDYVSGQEFEIAVKDETVGGFVLKFKIG